jgi:hypothetical protein
MRAVRKRTKTIDDAAPRNPDQATRDALDFCFEDLSAVHVVGAAPLTDLTSGRAPAAPASAGAQAEQRSAQRWNLVMLVLLLLTLAATTAAMLFAH